MLKRRAFTLIELLVVIGIIALLLAVLLPAANRVRFNAKCAVCAANLRQISAAMSHYATDNGGWLPLISKGQSVYWAYGAGNAYDVSPDYIKLMLRECRIPKTSMYCPFQDDDVLTAMAATPNPGITTQSYPNYPVLQFGYLDWIPRWNGNWDLAPPLVPGTYTNDFSYPMPLDPTPFAGPQRLSDSTAKDNPIFTDFVSSDAMVSSSIVATDPGSALSWFSNHQWRNRLDNINAAFADGHVEAIAGSAVHPRYAGGRLCWR